MPSSPPVAATTPGLAAGIVQPTPASGADASLLINFVRTLARQEARDAVRAQARAMPHPGAEA
jgi:hypothetical protein